MSDERRTGLVSRTTADRVAVAFFFAALVFFLVLLLPGSSSDKLPAATTSTSSTLQVVRGSHGTGQSTQTTEKTTTDVVPSVWLNLLGKRQKVFLIFGAAILTSYFLAAITQRILLGRYALTVGPFSVPEVTEEEVKQAADSVLSATPQDASAAETADQESEEAKPIWENVGDPNLALAGWRIDIERELQRIAGEFDVPARTPSSVGRIVIALRDRRIIPLAFAESLQNLLAIANRGVHGATVDEGVMNVLRTEGIDILKYLRSVSYQPGDPGPLNIS